MAALFESAFEAARLAKGVTYAGRTRRPITSVAISSKEAAPGSLFVALRGSRADGHDYIGEAVRSGAVAAMVERSQTYKALLQVRGGDCALITVPDTLKGLQDLARGYARKRKANLIAITGSCGKTTTKEILASILGMSAPTAKTPGNLNSLVGLPLSIFSLEPRCAHGVFEIGVDHAGEMETLAGILQPDIAILTNIGESHLEKFGTVRSLVDEKRRIFASWIKRAYIGEDCRYKNYIAKLSSVPLRQFGIRSIRGLEEVVDLGLNGWILKFLGRRMHLSCLGWHSLTDCLGAIQVADDLGCSPAQIASGVDRVVQIPGRSKVYEGDVTVIDDSYNASFESSYAILDLVQKLSWKGRKNLVLGSMKELGAASTASHRMVGEKIARSKASGVFLYGPEMEAVRSYLAGQGYAGSLFHSNDFEEIESRVRSEMAEGDLFLVKGSRVMRMERLLPTLLGQTAPGPSKSAPSSSKFAPWPSEPAPSPSKAAQWSAKSAPWPAKSASGLAKSAQWSAKSAPWPVKSAPGPSKSASGLAKSAQWSAKSAPWPVKSAPGPVKSGSGLAKSAQWSAKSAPWSAKSAPWPSKSAPGPAEAAP